MDNQDHIPILKRVGTALIVIGLADIAYMIYCIMKGVSYSSSFNIFAVIAGVFLWRGNLRAVTIVRWLAALTCGAFALMPVVLLLIQPLDLTLTQIRLAPGGFVMLLAVAAFTVAVLFWVARELSRPAVVAAFTGAGRKDRDLRIPAAIGFAIAATVGIASVALRGGDIESRAAAIAAEETGPGYRFYVNAVNIRQTSEKRFVQCGVVAWNGQEIRNMAVHWEE